MMKFFRDRRANVAMTFALTLTPIVVLSGSATDFSLVYAERQRAQDALDRATLAGAKDIGQKTTAAITTEVTTLFKDFYQAPTGSSASVHSVVVDTAKGKVTAQVALTVDTNFMPIININEITSNIVSEVAMGNSDFDVVMVLDTSGSMAGTKIATLKTAANNLTNTLMNMNVIGGRSDRVKLAVVPFSGAVNVGASFGPTYSGTTRTSDGTGAAWLDVNTRSPIHNENWNSGLTANRFDLFAKLAAAYPTYASKLKWSGCVEMRAYPYSVDDTPPSVATPATLFVPMFAPDEAGYKSGSNWTTVGNTYNDYLNDIGGSCSSTIDVSTTSGKLAAQGRTCKYNAPATAAFRNASSLGSGWGPNYTCKSQAIQSLTNVSSTITSMINALAANGNTNILEGVAWGLRVLSPAAPFTEGRTGTQDRPLQRVMIVMTDGDNTYGTDTASYNTSSYGPYGFLRLNRLGLTTITSSNVLSKQNSLTLEACSNAKNFGVTVYTIALEVDSTTTKNMLKSCATDASYAFTAETSSELLSAFETIANQISRLRISS